jgi:serine/threonine protein kinase/WD40 repeat protein
MALNETATGSCPEPDDRLIVRFLRELEEGDAEEVLRRHCLLYPDRAEELRDLAATHRALGMGSGDDQPASPEPIPDRLGDFRIVRRIARGGMGSIYEAIQEPFGRRVAVKTIREDRRHLSGQARERFLREQEVLAQLHHTNIVPIHAGGTQGNLQYFAMPYIEGVPLSHVVESVRRLGSTASDVTTPSLAELACGVGEDCESADSTLASNDEVRRPSPGGGRKGAPQLSTRYLRSVAKVVADAADALQHAHDVRVIHRDIKPSNLMVDRHENCWVLDFGLAAHHAAEGGDAPGSGEELPNVEPLTTSGVLGTPDFMAPEQFLGKADARSDVWGLGVTLYELLTLTRAFPDGTAKRVVVSPTPRDRVRGLPRDLEAICARAMSPALDRRYQSASELAADLRHWLNHEPVAARPARPFRRFVLWARRNTGWAVALCLALTSLAALGLGSLAFAGVKAQEATAKERELSRQITFQKLVSTRREIGWSSDIWGRVREQSRIGGNADLQAQAIASLSGLDARAFKRLQVASSSIVFDATGRRLALAGDTESPGGPGRETTGGTWDSETDTLASSKRSGPGLVAFDRAGVAVQLGPAGDDLAALSLWTLADGAEIRRFRPDAGPKAKLVASSMTPDAATVASLVSTAEGAGTITVWDAATGRVRRTIAHRPGDVELAPDGALIAAPDESGTVTVWSVDGGAIVARLMTGRTPITCLAFGRDRLRRERPAGPADGWLLAVGDAGGNVTSWDLGSGYPREFMPESSGYQVHAVAYSPDGTLLATAGRNRARLWDAASGRLLLVLEADKWLSDVAFSPGGDRLAVSHRAVFGDRDGVTVYELEHGRHGLRDLRGHRGKVEKLRLSRDQRKLAVLTADWRVAIWDRESGALEHLLEVPQGDYADNSAMAFGTDGRRFSFSTGTRAKLWDLGSGRVREWTLPPGLQDTLIDSGPDRLILIRAETRDGKKRPYGPIDVHAPGEARLVRMRNLLAEDPLTSVREYPECNQHVHAIVAAPDGSSFAIGGVGLEAGKPVVHARVYGRDGAPLGDLPRLEYPEQPWFHYDPSGSMLLFYTGATEHPRDWMLAVPSLRAMRNPGLTPLGQRGELGLKSDATSTRLVYMEAGRPREAATLVSPYTPGYLIPWTFSPDGRFLLGTSDTGEVVVADLPTIQRRLAELGLGW